MSLQILDLMKKGTPGNLIDDSATDLGAKRGNEREYQWVGIKAQDENIR